jgi:hypothetical protein
MPARDIYHEAVKAALVNDGWTVTDEHYVLRIGKRRVFIDIAAEENLIAAEQAGRKIAVEVKSFVGASAIEDLRDAIGQYVLYRSVLRRKDPDRAPYLAVDMATERGLLAEELSQALIDDETVNLLVVDVTRERIVAWKPHPTARL